MTNSPELGAQIRAMIEKAQRSLAKGKSYSKHTGVISGFGEYFIAPGIFPKDFAKRIAGLFRNSNFFSQTQIQ